MNLLICILLFYTDFVSSTKSLNFNPKSLLCAKTKMNSKCVEKISDLLTPNEKLKILTILNEFRDKIALGKTRGVNGTFFPKAANMEELVWNDELANLAIATANSCRLTNTKHSQVLSVRYGEVNVSIASILVKVTPKNENFTDDLQNVIQRWINAKKYFDPADISKYPMKNNLGYHSGLYKYFITMVRGDSKYIGCAASSYTRKEKKVKLYPRLLVCYFMPGGTNINESIYKIGEPCSDCPGKEKNCSEKYPGLCGQESLKKRKNLSNEKFLFPSTNTKEFSTYIDGVAVDFRKRFERNLEKVPKVLKKVSTVLEKAPEVLERVPKVINTSSSKTLYREKKSYERPLKENMLQKEKIDTLDQDTNFALSLVPLMKALPVDKKIDVQIMVLKIFQSISYTQQLEFPLPPPPPSLPTTETSKDLIRYNLFAKLRPLDFQDLQHLTSSETIPIPKRITPDMFKYLQHEIFHNLLPSSEEDLRQESFPEGLQNERVFALTTASPTVNIASPIALNKKGIQSQDQNFIAHQLKTPETPSSKLVPSPSTRDPLSHLKVYFDIAP